MSANSLSNNDPLGESNFPTKYDLETTCSIIGCAVTFKTNPDICFFPMPKFTPNTPLSYQHIQKKRRIAWLKCLDLNLSAKRYDVVRICGSHFVFGKRKICFSLNTFFLYTHIFFNFSGKPANILNYYHVDWVPSINIGENIADTRKNYVKIYKPFRYDISEWYFFFCTFK